MHAATRNQRAAHSGALTTGVSCAMPCASAHAAPPYSTAARMTLRRLSSVKKERRSVTGRGTRSLRHPHVELDRRELLGGLAQSVQERKPARVRMEDDHHRVGEESAESN